MICELKEWTNCRINIMGSSLALVLKIDRASRLSPECQMAVEKLSDSRSLIAVLGTSGERRQPALMRYDK
jgi:hypothetical protein